MRQRGMFYIFMGAGLLFMCGYFVATKVNLNSSKSVGQVIDEFNRIKVYFNAAFITHQDELNSDGYNLGIKYQCVEFVKRYYLSVLNIKCDSHGHAKDFVDQLSLTAINQRMLLQFRNGSLTKPRSEDILVFGPSLPIHTDIL